MEDLNLEEFKDLKLDLKEKVLKVKERRLVLNEKGCWVLSKDKNKLQKEES